MCGIWLYMMHNGPCYPTSTCYSNAMNIHGRGPDDCHISYYKGKYMVGFHRLAIMDVSSKGSQPFIFYHKKVKYTCICNGEIYNAETLKTQLNESYSFKSSSDCEVLIPLYLEYGNSMVEHLDGVFAFVIIVEPCNGDSTHYYIARDRFGIRPLYIGKDNYGNFIVGSELKSMKTLANESKQFPPGYYKNISFYGNYQEITTNYYSMSQYAKYGMQKDIHKLYKSIRDTLIHSVEKRLLSDRPVCALLSGGLDSSLVCSIASYLLKKRGQTLHTFSIGIEGSPDNIYAEKVANHIGARHTIVKMDVHNVLETIRSVIWATETYDITTIRASVGQYLVCKYIAEHTDYKVLLSGDGSDEVTSGYLENYMCPNLGELHMHAIRRLKEIHFYDVLRADRATSIHGLELRVPFLDKEFVENYLRINPCYRAPNADYCEKYLLRKSFDAGFLPTDVLWRQKEAFSDGISSESESWFTIIQKHCESIVSDEQMREAKTQYTYCTPQTKEAYYYRKTFDAYYGNKFATTIPGFWMPEWSEGNDPSARTLAVYNTKKIVSV